MSQVILARLLHKLGISEQPFAEYLASAPQVKASTAGFGAKLLQIDAIISSITPEEVELANEWRERLMMICRQYSGVVRFDPDNAESSKPSKSSNSAVQNKTSKISTQVTSDSNLVPPSGFNNCIQSPVQTGKHVHFEEEVKKNDADAQLSKNVIRSQMENAFGKLAMVASAADIEAMQQLLKLVAKANAMAMPFWNDHQLQLDLFDYAFAKLPEESRHRFMMEHNSEQPDSEL